jgi:hypothetical protein
MFVGGQAVTVLVVPMAPAAPPVNRPFSPPGRNWGKIGAWEDRGDKGKPFPARTYTMSIFYLMPPRPFLGDRVADFLQSLFPGLAWDSSARARLAELLGNVAGEHEGVYVIYRDDLPREEAPVQALVHGFGAEAGDEIVEVRPSGRPGELVTRRWRIER